MSANAFGGHHRIDKTDLTGPSLFGDVLVDVESGTQPERVLWLASIQDAAHSYLFYGLSKNCAVASEFWHSVEYFFHTRASKPETWRAARIMRDSYVDEDSGRRVTRVQRIPDDVLKFQCVDVLWQHLNFPITLEMFCTRLEAERRQLLQRNWDQVSKYLRLDRTFAECINALVCPSGPSELEHVLYGDRISGLTVAA